MHGAAEAERARNERESDQAHSFKYCRRHRRPQGRSYCCEQRRYRYHHSSPDHKEQAQTAVKRCWKQIQVNRGDLTFPTRVARGI